jgi:hypothetical protein
MAALTSRGKLIWDTLLKNLRIIQNGPRGGRTRPIIWGVTPNGVFVDGMTLDAFLARAGNLIRSSERVYVWEDTLVYELRERGKEQLLLLGTRHRAEPGAAGVLANLFGVGVRGEERVAQSMVPPKLVGAVLADEDLWRRLPAIRYYSRRPLFDDDFKLCGPGWNAAQGILVHGPDVEPILAPAPASGGTPIPGSTPGPAPTPGLTPAPATAAPAGLDRLPAYLGRLLRGFCWASEADLTNAVALLLTGLLSNHFIRDPKPIGLIDGNQKGLGKTLLVQTVGHVLDDAEPPRLPLVRDEELEKKLCAQLREARSGLFFFDNVRDRVESALIEANALSPLLSFRILGQSGTISRPNTFLWVITSNQTSGTEDLISRGLPIRLRFEGNPRERTFGENPLDVARQFRLEILGELAGMVVRWKQAGMPIGAPKHRCQRWAEVIGGILAVSGLGQFLANVEEAEAVMDEGLQALSGLAEYVVEPGLIDFFLPEGAAFTKESGSLPKDWTPLFLDTEVCRDKLAEKSTKGRDTWVGTFLSGKIDRKVIINTPTGRAVATLRRIPVRCDQKRYYFEIWRLLGDDVAGEWPSNTTAASLPGELTGAAGGEWPKPTSAAVPPAASGGVPPGNDLNWN